MANLLWKTKHSTKKLLSTPFQSEEDFEKFVFETKEILEDIFLIKRQVRGGNKPGIPDIIGIDNDGTICIVEMKNKKVDSSILPQVLQYAIWAETNPDSIKALWLEAKDKPEDFDFTWDTVQVRIIIIAPAILPSTLKFADTIRYVIDLVEVNRWVEKDNHLVLVKKLEPEIALNKIRPVKGLPVYNEEFYKTYRNKQSVTHFLKYSKEVESIIKSRGWELETKFNRNFVSYKAGFFLAFRIIWLGSKSFAFSIPVSKNDLIKFKIKPTKYNEKKKRAIFQIEPGKTKTTDFITLFELAYNKLTGK